LNGEWELRSTSAEWRETVLSCCPQSRYPYVQFSLRLRRRYAFYALNVIVPCALLSVLATVGFCLPPDAGEKVSLGISVVLAIIVFLLLLAETVPRTSLHVPIIGTHTGRGHATVFFVEASGQSKAELSSGTYHSGRIEFLHL